MRLVRCAHTHYIAWERPTPNIALTISSGISRRDCSTRSRPGSTTVRRDSNEPNTSRPAPPPKRQTRRRPTPRQIETMNPNPAAMPGPADATVYIPIGKTTLHNRGSLSCHEVILAGTPDRIPQEVVPNHDSTKPSGVTRPWRRASSLLMCGRSGYSLRPLLSS